MGVGGLQLFVVKNLSARTGLICKLLVVLLICGMVLPYLIHVFCEIITPVRQKIHKPGGDSIRVEGPEPSIRTAAPYFPKVYKRK